MRTFHGHYEVLLTSLFVIFLFIFSFFFILKNPLDTTPSPSEDHQPSKEEKENASHWKEMILNAINEREQTEQEKLVRMRSQ